MPFSSREAPSEVTSEPSVYAPFKQNVCFYPSPPLPSTLPSTLPSILRPTLHSPISSSV